MATIADAVQKAVQTMTLIFVLEGDTMYLAACTKGATSASVREQPFSSIPAKQRAYSLKSSYMTRILNSYIFGDMQCERIIKAPNSLRHYSFEELLIRRVQPFYGKTQAQLKAMCNIDSTAKNLNELIVAKILGVEGKIAYTEEFQKAGIVPKTIRVQRKGVRCEAESEGSLRQNLGLTNRNCIQGTLETDEFPIQNKVQYCPNFKV